MAITTLAGINTGQQFPRNYNKTNLSNNTSGNTLWAVGGSPIAGAYNGTLNGVVLSSSSAQVTGQIPFFNPPSGNMYLSRMEIVTNVATAGLCLYDRLWHNGGIDLTSILAQGITSPTWPARDVSGSTDGEGVYLALEVSATCGAAAPVITVSYTNSAGTAGRTGTNIIPTASGTTAGSIFLISLQAGDVGVRSVQSITLDTPWISGTINLVAFREIARLDLGVASVTNAIDGITGALPIMWNGSVPYCVMYPIQPNSTLISGVINFTAG